ncbi:hypothetical protein [Microbulbifer hydrolyticus]|uniref:Uncharacterized protein n=1 Tax=Microbulbifer hydrolyticus TaxID=48074 RepID=A0A6P1T966_9GAMM|nr:hypothetical protein [Microbulbifer hydrolyticus]MBB5210134.1 hypothetical protein [Microbulbifer hydrolyticus]QHQ39348.1 hypothetical protein GTQ55_10355 [Microbulbifer hydrolyticus]
MTFDAIDMAGNKARGKRPTFFKDTDTDRLLSILMALAGELAVARERIDTLERLLEARNLLKQTDIEGYVPDTTAARERGLWHQEFIARILRVVQQEIEQFDEDREAQQQARRENVSASTELEELIEELASS